MYILSIFKFQGNQILLNGVVHLLCTMYKSEKRMYGTAR